MFTFIRLVLLLLVAAAVFFAIRRSRIRHKKRTFFLILAACIVISGVLSVFAVENLFVRFDSPEKAFHYMKSGEIEHVLYGKETCVVAYHSGSVKDTEFCVIARKNDAYTVPFGTCMLVDFHMLGSNYTFQICRLTGTQENYVFGFITANQVQLYRQDGSPAADCALFKEGDSIDFYLDGPPEEFYLMADGQRIDFSEE